jgi:hypothetical protein
MFKAGMQISWKKMKCELFETIILDYCVTLTSIFFPKGCVPSCLGDKHGRTEACKTRVIISKRHVTKE